MQYYGQKETEPYIRCSILLDGTDQPIMGVDVRDIPLEEFRVGMRLAGRSGSTPAERTSTGSTTASAARGKTSSSGGSPPASPTSIPTKLEGLHVVS